jgi:NADH-quinone oxidoreductase subunit K
MTVAAAEATLGLAIVVALFRNLETVNVDEINQMKG